MKKKYLVGIGEILWDVNTRTSVKTLGGAPANFAYHAGAVSRLIGSDLSGLVVSAVGNDPLAAETIAELKAVQLDCQLPNVGHPTGLVNVTYDKQGEPQYDIVKEVAWDYIPYEGLESLATQTRAVCFGTLAQRSPESCSTIRRFLRAVTEDCMRICDLNLREPFYTEDVVRESMELCNVLKINKDEAAYISTLLGVGALSDIKIPGDGESLERFASQLCRKFALKMVVITCGRDGSFVFTDKGEMSFKGTPKVEQVSAVGAGDSFTGTLCACLAAGWPVGKAHEAAVAVSAYVVTQPGAMPNMDAAPLSF